MTTGSRRQWSNRRGVVPALALLVLACGAPREPFPVDPSRYDVRILRDSWGVPHVFGKSDADVGFGLAYAHAEDDFPTIQQALLASRGLLASVEGADAAPNDYLVGLLRIWDTVNALYDVDLSPATRALCQAYADGINHYANLHPEAVRGDWLPATGRDIVAGFVHKTPLFFGLQQVAGELLGPERARSVSPRPVASTTFRADSPELPVGSNAFAVAPRRSADGKTRLAVNSHQPWEGPVAWYEVHLHSEEGWDMAGGVFPGSPVVFHGHNRNLGWAHTVNLPDLVDVYVLETDPRDPGRYRVDGEWRELETFDVPIRVKLWGPFHWTVKREALASIYGPALRTPHGTYALRYAGSGDVRLVEQWYAMNKAANRDEWEAAMRMGALPSFNTVYADREGNIAYVYNALLPIREEGWDWSGYLPGDTSATLWKGYLAWDDLPHVSNPRSGFVISSNSDPFRATVGPDNDDPSRFSPTFGIERTMTNRALRALELFGADESISGEEFERYKFDMRYSKASDLEAFRQKLLALPMPEDPLLREAREVLAGWDLGTEPDDTGAAIGVLTLQPVVTAARQRNAGRDALVPDLEASFEAAARALHAAHGRVDVPWSEVNRIRRGKTDLGVGGGPDILHAVYGGKLEDGRITGKAGDSLVYLVEWGDDGVRSRSIHQYGSATLDENSPHYDDQTPLFARRQLKPVWLDESEIRAHLEREYRPGEEAGR